VLEDQYWLRQAGTDDRAGVSVIVLSALEHETLDGPPLQF
jgi:hypothetical protein